MTRNRSDSIPVLPLNPSCFYKHERALPPLPTTRKVPPPDFEEDRENGDELRAEATPPAFDDALRPARRSRRRLPRIPVARREVAAAQGLRQLAERDRQRRGRQKLDLFPRDPSLALRPSFPAGEEWVPRLVLGRARGSARRHQVRHVLAHLRRRRFDFPGKAAETVSVATLSVFSARKDPSFYGPEGLNAFETVEVELAF